MSIMIIKLFPSSHVDITVHQLPEPDMVVNPRPTPVQKDCNFVVSVNGTAIIITRINRKQDERPGWPHSMFFWVYSRNEFHYSFESTKYLYHGIKYEYAPHDAMEIVFKDGIETIRTDAFNGCYSLPKITIPHTVTRIERYTFFQCHSLQYIQLPLNLEYIGGHAFCECLFLELVCWRRISYLYSIGAWRKTSQ